MSDEPKADADGDHQTRPPASRPNHRALALSLLALGWPGELTPTKRAMLSRPVVVVRHKGKIIKEF